MFTTLLGLTVVLYLMFQRSSDQLVWALLDPIFRGNRLELLLAFPINILVGLLEFAPAAVGAYVLMKLTRLSARLPEVMPGRWLLVCGVLLALVKEFASNLAWASIRALGYAGSGCTGICDRILTGVLNLHSQTIVAEVALALLFVWLVRLLLSAGREQEAGSLPSHS